MGHNRWVIFYLYSITFPSDLSIAYKKYDGKEPIPMFSFILRKHPPNDKRIPEIMKFVEANDDEKMDIVEIARKIRVDGFTDFKKQAERLLLF